MNERLTHSAAGYRRLIQISQAEMLVIVEGRLDRFFYHEVCSVILRPHNVRFDVRMVAELPVSTGGKPGVLEFYDFLRKSSALVDDFKGKRSVVVFILDKDVDDVTRRKRRSLHVIYTDLYEAENYLFRYGDVARALAASLQLPQSWVDPLLPADWLVAAAEAWKDWVVLCLTVQVLRISAPANYRVPSRVNTPCAAPTDAVKLTRFVNDLRARSGVSSLQFDRVSDRVQRTVERLYRADRHDSVFRGKWYLSFLHFWAASSGSSFSDDQLLSTLLASLDYSAPWVVHFTDAISKVARQSQLIA